MAQKGSYSYESAPRERVRQRTHYYNIMYFFRKRVIINIIRNTSIILMNIGIINPLMVVSLLYANQGMNVRELFTGGAYVYSSKL